MMDYALIKRAINVKIKENQKLTCRIHQLKTRQKILINRYGQLISVNHLKTLIEKYLNLKMAVIKQDIITTEQCLSILHQKKRPIKNKS
jgi:hypothetical protein